MSKENVYLMYVDIKDGVQSNKFYNMTDNGNGNFTVEYGRVGSTKSTKVYPISRWRSTYNSKVRKGYKDITDLKITAKVVTGDSGNKDFDSFYNHFKKYTGDVVNKSYLVEGCSQGQMDEAQNLVNKLSTIKKVDKFNEVLFDIYKVIPRRMGNVRHHMATTTKDFNNYIKIEQEALDAMDSANVINVSNPFKELNIGFKDVTAKELKKIEELLYPSMQKKYQYGGNRSATIKKIFKISDDYRTDLQQSWLKNQKNKKCELLIHGTRNANVFGILKSGLLIRPANAHISGSVYGDGVYHSAHSAKSLGYTGHDKDKLFFLQNVHMGNPYTYSGWYRDGKDISRSQMNYQYLKSEGYDSLFVKAGDGLLNSEYIVYNKEQTNTHYLVWMTQN